MPLSPIALPDAKLALDPTWLRGGEADRLLADLLVTIPWQVHRIRLFGREVDSPRLSCWIGDPDAVYTYSGTRFEPRSWPDSLMSLRTCLRRQLDVDFNSVLGNLYRDGRDRMGWHSDNERELGPAPVIASVSLGATRRFVLKRRDDPSIKLALELPHGSLLVMAGNTQSHYRHALPATAKPVGARINLTFRRIANHLALR
jgi:alkylated DNA repair dioxygenase AlkB